MAARTNVNTLFRVAKRIKIPLALSGLIVIVLYLVFSRGLALKMVSDLGPDNMFLLLRDILRYVFWLANIALVLGAGSFALAMLLKHRIETRNSQVQLVDARLDAHDSPYEQTIVNGERQIRPRRHAAKRAIHTPFNSCFHHKYVDGEELLRRDAKIEQARLRQSALKGGAERGWLVLDQAATDPAGRRYYLTRPGMSRHDGVSTNPHESNAADKASSSTKKHIILFLAGNPVGADQRALEREARAIQVELERSGCRDAFECVTRWAVEPLDLLRELRKLKPTVVHFSGSCAGNVAGTDAMAIATGDRTYDETPSRDIIGPSRVDHGEERHGLFFEAPGGYLQFVSTTALEETFRAAGGSVKIVVLNACYSEVQAEALRAHVDCVVGMGGSMCGDATRNFAIGFYGGLGEREPVAVAFKQGCAAIHLDGLREADQPRLKVRDGVDPDRLVLAADPGSRTAYVHRNIFSDPYSGPVFTLVARWTSKPKRREIDELEALFPLMDTTEIGRARKGLKHEMFTIGRFTEPEIRPYASQLESLGVELERIPVIQKH